MTKHTAPPKMASSGFTLIELMVTVAIVAILATIAVASLYEPGSEVAAYGRAQRPAGFGRARGKALQHHQRLQRRTVGPRLRGRRYAVADRGGQRLLQGERGGPGNPPVTYVITATAIGTQANDTHMRDAQRESAGCAIVHRDRHGGNVLGELIEPNLARPAAVAPS